MKLGDDGSKISEQRERGVAMAINARELFGRNVDLDELGCRGVLGGFAVVQDPIEAGHRARG